MRNKITCFDVAKYILENYEDHRRRLKKTGHDMRPIKLNILVYYCQVWSLLWDGKALFNEDIKACTLGPIIEVLYNACKFEHVKSKEIEGDTKKLSRRKKFIIDNTLFCYAAHDYRILIRISISDYLRIKSYNTFDEDLSNKSNVIPHSDIVECYSKFK